jgi:hypothetical protein
MACVLLHCHAERLALLRNNKAAEMAGAKTSRAVTEAIDLAYDAATDDASWPLFLAAAGDLVDADNAYLSHIRHDRMQLDYVVLDQSRWEPVALERYRRMMHVDALMGPLHRHRLTPIHCGEAVPGDQPL